ncbi:MAG TPA: hypothetical protein VFE54_12055 [Mucilaginibacter sp.]|nr:hypothetical protein [Mucilaginibacter sp.]
MIVVVTNIIIFLFLLVLPDDQVHSFGGYFILAQYLVFSVHFLRIFDKDKRLVAFFSPSFITLTYLCLSLGLGQISLQARLGFEDNYIDNYLRNRYIRVIDIYFCICNAIVYYSLFRFKKFKLTSSLPKGSSSKHIITFASVLVAVILFVIFSIIDFDIPFFGNSTSSFSDVPKLASALVMVFYVSERKFKWRGIFYILLLLGFAATQFNSKREIIFLLIGVVWIEYMFNKVSIKGGFKTVALIIIGFFFFAYLILVASILRGYGDYQIHSFWDANRFVGDYIQQSYFKNALVTNFELNAVYSNSSNGMQYVLSGSQPLLFGSTFLKLFFLPIPRALISFKPDAMIDIYTRISQPSLYAAGGSLPIIYYVELFWNFWYFALPLLALSYNFMNAQYFKLVYKLNNKDFKLKEFFILFLYVIFIQFVRGSGVALWAMYPIIGIPFLYFILLFSRKKKEPAIVKKAA